MKPGTNRAARRRQGKGPFDLIEEATHLLRTAPAATLAAYFLGAVPFVLGLLFFWADMSRSPFAHRHLADAALGLAALFFWMKFWQSIFALRLRAQLAGEPSPQFNFRRCVRIFLLQTIVQPCGLFLLPLALLPIIPFPWTYAFFQNATALGDGHDGHVWPLVKKSRQQAALWPAQNFLALLILLAFALYVFLNWTTAGLMLPHLCQSLLGLDSGFTKHPWAMLNTTFFAGMFGLTYLCVDPILKAIYTLRCFYGESLASGEDLKADLKTFSIPLPQAAAAVIFICATILFSSPATAAGTNDLPTAAQKISTSDLDQAIAKTISQSKYTWRLPREKIVDDDSRSGVVMRFFESVGQTVRHAVQSAWRWVKKIWDKMFPSPHTHHAGDDASGYGWIMSAQVLLYALVAAVAAALAIFLYRVWRGRQKISATVAEAILPVPDLADENVRADQLPEDGWTKLARELLERGEFRLAMRAFYLASLAHLAARNLISIARFKSNRDYERELGRRAHAFPDLLSVFGANIFDFERIWYGNHEADRERVDHFAANVERIKTGG